MERGYKKRQEKKPLFVWNGLFYLSCLIKFKLVKTSFLLKMNQIVPILYKFY
ncbi:hypothetical protein IV76_GL000978 [Carnobacterium maltaromaticum]|nr:hypothetical protein IV76_GL000978 [Carnobacterium maltaromaticum]